MNWPVSTACTPTRLVPGNVNSWTTVPASLARTVGASNATRKPCRWSCLSRLAASKWNWSGSKKKLIVSTEAKRALVEPDNRQISLRRQSELLGLKRSTLYYTPIGASEVNLGPMRLIDEQCTRTPANGWLPFIPNQRRHRWMDEPRSIRIFCVIWRLQA